MHVADRWRCVLCRLELISAGVSGVCVVTGSAAVLRGVRVGCAHQVRATLQVRCESVFCGASCVVGTAESWRCVLSRQQCSGEVVSGVCAVTRLCGSIQRCLSRVSVSGQGDTAGTWRVRILTAHDAWCMVHAAESWRCMLSKQQRSTELGELGNVWWLDRQQCSQLFETAACIRCVH